MRLLVWILCLVPALAQAGGPPADGINWFTIGDPHSLAMAWFMLNFLLFAGGLALVIRGPIMSQVRQRAERFEKLLRYARAEVADDLLLPTQDRVCRRFRIPGSFDLLPDLRHDPNDHARICLPLGRLPRAGRPIRAS